MSGTTLPQVSNLPQCPPFRLIVTGGGTGGHTYPALTAVHALKTRLHASGRALDVLWVGTKGSLEERVAESEGIAFKSVATGKIRRSSNPLKLASPTNVRDMGRAARGVAQARTIVSAFNPDVVLATGGYVAIPVGMAAKMRHRPLVVHEQTVRLGLANRTLARGSGATFAVSHEATLPLLPEHCRTDAVVTGNPVRPELMAGQPEKAVEALALQSFDRHLPTIYVTGGAQGSQQINHLFRDALPWLLTSANIVHQCGPDNLPELQRHATTLPADLSARYHVTGYVGAELPDVLALADIVIARSGAGTIAEMTALGKPSILIPLATSAGGEQAHNARHLAENGAALALLDDIDTDSLREAVTPLLSHPDQRADMATQARHLGRPDAAERLVDVLLNATRGE